MESSSDVNFHLFDAVNRIFSRISRYSLKFVYVIGSNQFLLLFFKWKIAEKIGQSELSSKKCRKVLKKVTECEESRMTGKEVILMFPSYFDENQSL